MSPARNYSLLEARNIPLGTESQGGVWYFMFTNYTVVFCREDLVPRISTAASSTAKQEGVERNWGGAFWVRIYFGQNKNNLKGGEGAKQGSWGAQGPRNQ